MAWSKVVPPCEMASVQRRMGMGMGRFKIQELGGSSLVYAQIYHPKKKLMDPTGLRWGSGASTSTNI